MEKNVIIKCDKFHTIKIVSKSLALLDEKEASLRSLLSYVLKSTNNLYKSQYLWSRKLASLYDASYSVYTSKYGNYTSFTFMFTFVHPKWILDRNYTIENMYELFINVTKNPFIINEEFPNDILELAKKELINDLQLKKEDKASITKENALKNYFKGTRAAICEDGKIDEIEKITGKELYQYYKKVMNEPRINIIAGELTDKDLPKFEGGDFNKIKNYLCVDKPIKEFTKIEDTDKVSQTNIYVIYNTDIYRDNDDYFKLILLNYILGATPTSKLFLNVREKNSLCYAIRSNVSSIQGILTVFAGINKTNLDRTLELIDEQIDSIKNGDFSEDIVEEAKKYYVDAISSANDNQNNYIIEEYMKNCIPDYISPNDSIKLINAITKNEIMQVSKVLTKKMVYILGGESK